MTSQTIPETRSGSGISQHLPLMVVLMLGLFLAILNQTLLNVALPHLINEFGVATTTGQWLLTGYMLVNGVLIPLSAFLIERFGVRRLFLIAMVCFTVGALICSIAPNFSVMLTGRLIQAIGGGVLQPLVMSVIMFIFFRRKCAGEGWAFFWLGDDVRAGDRTYLIRLGRPELRLASALLGHGAARPYRCGHRFLQAAKYRRAEEYQAGLFRYFYFSGRGRSAALRLIRGWLQGLERRGCAVLYGNRSGINGRVCRSAVEIGPPDAGYARVQIRRFFRYPLSSTWSLRPACSGE